MIWCVEINFRALDIQKLPYSARHLPGIHFITEEWTIIVFTQLLRVIVKQQFESRVKIQHSVCFVQDKARLHAMTTILEVKGSLLPHAQPYIDRCLSISSIISVFKGKNTSFLSGSL